MEIKSAGLKVIGFGEEKTTPRTRESYSDFVVLPELAEQIKPPKQPAKQSLEPVKSIPTAQELSATQLEFLKKNLTAIFQSNPNHLDKQGFFKLNMLGTLLGQQKISPKNYGFVNWRALFTKHPSLGILNDTAFQLTPLPALPKTQQNEQSQPPLHKLKPAQVLELRKILEEVFNNKTSEMDSAGFLDMNKICPFLNQKAPLKNYTAKTYQSLFKSNPILGEYKKGKFKFKKI